MATAANIHIGSPTFPNVFGGETSLNLTQNTAYAAGIFEIECDASSVAISHLGIRYSTTLTPGADYTISLQSVGTNGQPTGTVLGGGSPASKTFTPSGSGWSWIALDNSYTANRGDLVAIVVTHNKLDAANFMAITYRGQLDQLATAGIPYGVTFDGTTVTVSPRTPIMGWRNSGSTIVGGAPSSNTTISNTFGSTVEVGMLFNVPTNVCSTFTVKGIRWAGVFPAGSSTNVLQASLYSLSGGLIDGTTTNIQNCNQVTNASGVSNGNAISVLSFSGTLTTLTAGNWYALGLSTTAAAAGGVAAISVAAAADFNAWAFQQNAQYANRTITFATPVATTTAFTATATTRPLIELILADLTAPAGGGVAKMAGEGGGFAG